MEFSGLNIIVMDVPTAQKMCHGSIFLISLYRVHIINSRVNCSRSLSGSTQEALVKGGRPKQNKKKNTLKHPDLILKPWYKTYFKNIIKAEDQDDSVSISPCLRHSVAQHRQRHGHEKNLGIRGCC